MARKSVSFNLQLPSQWCCCHCTWAGLLNKKSNRRHKWNSVNCSFLSILFICLGNWITSVYHVLPFDCIASYQGDLSSWEKMVTICGCRSSDVNRFSEVWCSDETHNVNLQRHNKELVLIVDASIYTCVDSYIVLMIWISWNRYDIFSRAAYVILKDSGSPTTAKKCKFMLFRDLYSTDHIILWSCSEMPRDSLNSPSFILWPLQVLV